MAGSTIGDEASPLALEALRKHAAIFAASGSGKRVLLRRLVESVKDCRRAADVVTRCQRLGAAAPGRPAETGA